MEDPVLNKSLEETRELQTRWNQFREFVRVAIERGKVSPEAEMKFLELKSFIAMLHDGFMAKLEHDQKTGQNIMSIVGDCIMLCRIAGYNDAEKQKFEFDWNECYLLISEQVQALEEKKEKLSQVSERSYNAGRRMERIQAKIYSFIHSAGLKWSITLGVLLLVFWIVPAYIWSYRYMKAYPGLSNVYSLVANKIYRPFLNSNYAYDTWQDVSINAEAPLVRDRIRREENRDLTEAYFTNNVINEMGMGRQNGDEARRLFRENKLHYETERWTADGRDVRLFYILFNTTADAKRFVELAVESLNDPGLSLDQKDAVTKNVHLYRGANLIAIGVSVHQMRSGHIKEKFYIKDDMINELRF
jgi:hypothetical protein